MMPGQQNLLTVEEKLLLSLCRLEFSEEQKEEIRRLLPGLKNWDRFVKLANEHSVIALCWNNLNETCNTDQIPEIYLSRLHSAYLKSLAFNTVLYKQLEELAELAEKNKIRIVLLKGIALEKTLYGDKGLRQLSDIDILSGKEHAIKFRDILIENRFDSLPLISPLHRKLLPFLKSHLPGLIKNGILVEIHARLFEPPANSMTETFFNKSLIPAGNNESLIYPENQLHFLYLVKHLVKHEKTGAFQIKFYIDLYLLLKTYSDEILNESLLNMSDKTNIKDALLEKLVILEIFWGFELPELIKLTVAEVNINAATNKFIRFLKCPEKTKSESDSESALKPLRDIPGLFNKVLFIAGYVFPSPGYIRYKYNVKTTIGAFLYFPVRWLKTLRQVLD